MRYTQHLVRIDSLDNPELSVFQQRSEVQLLRFNEPAPGLFVCESSKVIMRALDAGYEPVSFLVSERMADEAAGLIAGTGQTGTVDDGEPEKSIKNIPVYFGNDSVIQGISGYSLTGGMLCVSVLVSCAGVSMTGS